MNASLYISLIAGCAMLAGCSGSNGDSPIADDTPVTVCFDAPSFGSRADGTHYCDAELNEGEIGKLDLLLVNTSGAVIAHYSTSDKGGDNMCDGANHALVTFDEKRPDFSRQRIMTEGNRLILIANLPTDLSSCDNISSIKDLTGLAHNLVQHNFVMVGEIAASDVPATGNINITVRRIAAKISIKLYNPAQKEEGVFSITAPGTQITEYSSMLSHYVTSSPVLQESKSITTKGATATVECFGPDWTGTFENDIEFTDTDNGVIKGGAHIYYTYPTDWYNYERNTFSECTRTHEGNLKHKTGLKYWTIRNYDDEEPIVAERQMFAIVYTPYEGDGKSYYYKVPINFRLSDLNDRQCFNETELDDVLSLYRADRNHFYDVTAIIDRAGASTPQEAVSNPYFTATIADMNDGGTYDYIYD